MKSLILKDVYNISHNSKTMLFMLLMFIFFVPQFGPLYYVVMCAILSSMMVITTFNFDEMSDWMKYALVTPVSKKDVALSKYIVLGIFCLSGVILGSVLAVVSGTFFHKFQPASPADWTVLATGAGLGFVLSFFFGSLAIPMLFKFGAEKARILTIVSFALPVLIIAGIRYLLSKAGVVITEEMSQRIFLALPVAAAVIVVIMYVLSCKVLENKEF